MAVVLQAAQSYDGPTRIDGTELQQRGDDYLPPGTHVVLENGGILALTDYSSGNPPTAATIDGVEGSGLLNYCGKLTLQGTIAPSVGGTIAIETAGGETTTYDVALGSAARLVKTGAGTAVIARTSAVPRPYMNT